MSNFKPQEALQLGLNVLIDQSCEGENCRYHKYPYTIKSIISGENRKVEFKNIEDVLEYIRLLQLESREYRNKGGTFSELNNIWEQLPFFVCANQLIDLKLQKDISRYIYTRDTGTPPYSGNYGDTPHIWLQKHHIIKNAMIIRENKLMQKAQKENGN